MAEDDFGGYSGDDTAPSGVSAESLGVGSDVASSDLFADLYSNIISSLTNIGSFAPDETLSPDFGMGSRFTVDPSLSINPTTSLDYFGVNPSLSPGTPGFDPYSDKTFNILGRQALKDSKLSQYTLNYLARMLGAAPGTLIGNPYISTLGSNYLNKVTQDFINTPAALTPYDPITKSFTALTSQDFEKAWGAYDEKTAANLADINATMAKGDSEVGESVGMDFGIGGSGIDSSRLGNAIDPTVLTEMMTRSQGKRGNITSAEAEGPAYGATLLPQGQNQIEEYNPEQLYYS